MHFRHPAAPVHTAVFVFPQMCTHRPQGKIILAPLPIDPSVIDSMDDVFCFKKCRPQQSPLETV